jgi:hypothetical protein
MLNSPTSYGWGEKVGRFAVDRPLVEVNIWVYREGMAYEGRMISKSEARSLLRRVGMSEERIAAVLAELPDPFDADLEEPVLARHGITSGKLMDTLGGSP